MDLNQLKYQRVFKLSDEELEYKFYSVVYDFGTYKKRIVVRACCRQEILDRTKRKILSIRLLKKVSSQL